MSALQQPTDEERAVARRQADYLAQKMRETLGLRVEVAELRDWIYQVRIFLPMVGALEREA